MLLRFSATKGRKGGHFVRRGSGRLASGFGWISRTSNHGNLMNLDQSFYSLTFWDY